MARALPGIITVEQIGYMRVRGYAPEVLEGFFGRPGSTFVVNKLSISLPDGTFCAFSFS